MDIAGPAVAVTAGFFAVAGLIVLGVPVAAWAAWIVAKRSDVDPTDPWRLAPRMASQEPDAPDWRLGLERQLRGLPPSVPLGAAMARRNAEVEALERLMYGDRDVLPVVHGHGAGGRHRVGG